MTMHDQPVPKTHVFAAYGAREIRRVKRAAAGPFVRSIDGLVADGGLQASHTAQGWQSASGSADGTTSRWVMEKTRENARRAADRCGNSIASALPVLRARMG